MVGMPVRDEDGVDAAERGWIRCRPMSSQRAEPSSQHGIGEDAHTIEFDHHRRVTKVRQPQGVPHGALTEAGRGGARVARASRADCVPVVHAARGRG